MEDGQRDWTRTAPSVSSVISTLPTSSNILSIHVLDLVLPGMADSKQCIAATTADRRLNLIDPTNLDLLLSYSHFVDSPILDMASICGKYLLTASMSGRLVLFDTATNRILDERRDHSKYLVKLSTRTADGLSLIATAGWDSKIQFYHLKLSDDDIRLGDPVRTIELESIPETILFTQSPHDARPVLLLTRRDSSFLYYYNVPLPYMDPSETVLLGRQNLAPHSNAWVAFTPSDIQLSPHDPSIVAIATSTIPHMKLLLVRLLVPLPDSNKPQMLVPDSADTTSVTQASQARSQLLVQDREDAAIIINVTTMAPQTSYSTPKLAWRPDGTGIYVNSDDGVVRGFEASTGKLMASLQAHQPGSKIRCLWAGRLRESSTEGGAKEWLISGGFDQKLIAWKV